MTPGMDDPGNNEAELNVIHYERQSSQSQVAEERDMHWGRHYTLTHPVCSYDNGSRDQKTLRAPSDVTIPACNVTPHFNEEQAVILRLCVWVCARVNWGGAWGGSGVSLRVLGVAPWSMRTPQSQSSHLAAPITAHGHHHKYWCISQGQPLSSCSCSHTRTQAHTHTHASTEWDQSSFNTPTAPRSPSQSNPLTTQLIFAPSPHLPPPSAATHAHCFGKIFLT